VQGSELLLTSAQLGMALAGFAGLVTLIGRPDLRGEPHLNEIRFRSMVELSLMLVAFCLLPFVPAGLGASEAASWRIASAVYALAAFVFIVHSVRRNRSAMGRVLIAGRVTGALLGVCGVLALALTLAAWGAFGDREGGVYFAALFVHFLGAAFFFIRLLYGSLPRSEV